MFLGPRLWRKVCIPFVLVEQAWNTLIVIILTPCSSFAVTLSGAALYKRRIRGPFMAFALANIRSNSS